MNELSGHRGLHLVCVWNKAASDSQTAWHRCKHGQNVEAHLVGHVCVCVCVRRSAGLYVAAGSFMWPFVLFMCSCLSSVLCTDGSVPVIDGTLLLWCSRFNGA